MRRLLLAVSFLFAASASAQQSTRVSVYASDVFETDLSGFGAALEYNWSERLGAELAVASETHTISIGFLSGREKDVRTMPVDLMLHYRFTNQTRWEPYFGAGVHRLISSDEEVEERTSPAIDGGVHFMATPVFSIRLDARAVVNNEPFESYDPLLRIDLGVGWKF